MSHLQTRRPISRHAGTRLDRSKRPSNSRSVNSDIERCLTDLKDRQLRRSGIELVSLIEAAAKMILAKQRTAKTPNECKAEPLTDDP